MTTTYTITDTGRATYLDEATNKVVNGVYVTFRLDPYNEYHTLNFPKLDASAVTAAIKNYAAQRDLLAKGG